MKMTIRLLVVALLSLSSIYCQSTDDPFPNPISKTDRVIAVKFVEFAAIPDFNGGFPRIMTMVHEPGTQRYFASDMNGQLYAISSDGKTVTQYLDLTAADWSVGVQAQGSSRQPPTSRWPVRPARTSATHAGRRSCRARGRGRCAGAASSPRPRGPRPP